MPHDSAGRRGAQIINPLGRGTAASYSASWVWKAGSARGPGPRISPGPPAFGGYPHNPSETALMRNKSVPVLVCRATHLPTDHVRADTPHRGHDIPISLLG